MFLRIALNQAQVAISDP